MTIVVKAKKLGVRVDYNFNFHKLVNMLMVDGKKYLAYRIVFKMFAIIKQLLGLDPYQVLDLVIRKLKPIVDIRNRKFSKKKYEFPFFITSELKAVNMSFKWLVKFARLRSEKTMAKKLAAEIIDVYFDKGNSLAHRNALQAKAIKGIPFLEYLV